MTVREINQERLWAFVRESWKIEGETLSDVDCERLTSFHMIVLRRDRIDMDDLIYGATEFTKGKGAIRARPGMDMAIGPHVAPRGGPHIPELLNALVVDANNPDSRPFDVHLAFEHIHPFADGNGRTGRLLWLWMMHQRDENWSLGFLHTWYYQTLQAKWAYQASSWARAAD